MSTQRSFSWRDKSEVFFIKVFSSVLSLLFDWRCLHDCVAVDFSGVTFVITETIGIENKKYVYLLKKKKKGIRSETQVAFIGERKKKKKKKLKAALQEHSPMKSFLTIPHILSSISAAAMFDWNWNDDKSFVRFLNNPIVFRSLLLSQSVRQMILDHILHDQQVPKDTYVYAS